MPAPSLRHANITDALLAMLQPSSKVMQLTVTGAVSNAGCSLRTAAGSGVSGAAATVSLCSGPLGTAATAATAAAAAAELPSRPLVARPLG